jgi:O-antigen/teichoic acid export membrane protein
MAVDPLSRIFVASFAGPAAVAPLDIAIRTRAQFVGAIAAFARPLLPRIGAASQLGEDPVAMADSAWKRALTVIPALGVFTGVATILVFPSLFGGVGREAGLLSGVGIMLWLPSVVAVVPYSVLVVRGTARDLVYVQVVTSVVAVGVALVAVPLGGAWGAVIAYGIGAVAGAGVTLVRCRRLVAGSFGAPPVKSVRRPLIAVALATSCLLLPIHPIARAALGFMIWLSIARGQVRELVRAV